MGLSIRHMTSWFSRHSRPNWHRPCLRSWDGINGFIRCHTMHSAHLIKKIQIYMFLDIIGIWLTLTINFPINKDYPNKDILIIFDVWSFSSYTCLLTNWIWNELVFFYNHTLILLLSLFFISEICNRRLFSAYFFNLCAAAYHEPIT